ncbi:hypothetical protein J2752_001083 [Halarchaeum rubridurum]|uniref:Uncharacterized protein n=1 Tax=Halarchaeum rubridurum TaxID=489911 RepID=A0A8T4GNN9_9EURY|nr:hypothetical protein [Halarchaeum rubridurum]MBP1954202.1 hypothetical protein [Halarchaeum rubridurum]
MFGEEFDIFRKFVLNPASNAGDGDVSLLVLNVRVAAETFALRIGDECP